MKLTKEQLSHCPFVLVYLLYEIKFPTSLQQSTATIVFIIITKNVSL